jgi:hypothetical protein
MWLTCANLSCAQSCQQSRLTMPRILPNGRSRFLGNCSKFSKVLGGVAIVVILNRFLYLLKLLDTVAEFGEFLTSPLGITLVFCLLSYQAFMLMQCDATSATALASAAALTLHCKLNRPSF